MPFFFIRVDRAGNISKRQSATHFHFSKTGGSCPLWNVYEAFAQPGRILPQLASMPDGRVSVWIAPQHHSMNGAAGGRRARPLPLAWACDVQHAARLVYSKGLDLRNLRGGHPHRHGLQGVRAQRLPAAGASLRARPLRVIPTRAALCRTAWDSEGPAANPGVFSAREVVSTIIYLKISRLI